MKKSSSASSFGSDGLLNHTKKRVDEKALKFRVEYHERVTIDEDNMDQDDVE